jgi:glycosyltransferase involved in cell wall biosynthesis
LGGGLRRFVELAARVHEPAVKFTIVECEPFLKSFQYFPRANELGSKHRIVSVRTPLGNIVDNRVIGPIAFYLRLAIVTVFVTRAVRATRAHLVMAAGETMAEVITTFLASRITGRPALAVVQSNPFLMLGNDDVGRNSGFYAAFRTKYNPIVSFIESLFARAQVSAMNSMALLIVGSSLARTLEGYGIHGVVKFRIENGVDIEKIEQAIPSEPSADAVFVGRVDASKGVADLVSAWSKLADGGKRFTLTLIGPIRAGLKPQLEDLASASKGRISITGPLSSDGVIRSMKASRLLLLPSQFESFSLVTAEALACAIPVVAFDSPGIREFFSTEAVRRVPSGDFEALVSKANEILENETEGVRLGKLGASYVSRYSWDEVAAREVQILRDITESRLPRGRTVAA